MNNFNHYYSLFHSLQIYLHCVFNHKEVNYHNEVTQSGSYKINDGQIGSAALKKTGKGKGVTEEMG